MRLIGGCWRPWRSRSSPSRPSAGCSPAGSASASAAGRSPAASSRRSSSSLPGSAGGGRLLAPRALLAERIPGAPAVAHPDAHSLLNDTIYQFLPWELEIRHALARHQAPFWSDLLEGGSSPWANPQAGVLSPVQMAARLLPIQHHLLGALALKVLLAFEGTWLLARRLGRSRASCLLAAAGFAL